MSRVDQATTALAGCNLGALNLCGKVPEKPIFAWL